MSAPHSVLPQLLSSVLFLLNSREGGVDRQRDCAPQDRAQRTVRDNVVLGQSCQREQKHNIGGQAYCEGRVVHVDQQVR